MSEKKRKKEDKEKLAPYHHGDLHAVLLESATKLLNEKGVSGLSLREVARVAGVSHTAPYRHFEDKEALLAAVAEAGFNRLEREVSEVKEKGYGSAAKNLISIGEVYVKRAIANPNLASLMFGGSYNLAEKNHRLREAGERAFQELVDVVVQGQKSGQFSQGRSEDIVLAAWALVHGLSMLFVTERMEEIVPTNEEKMEITRNVTKLLLSGILKS